MSLPEPFPMVIKQHTDENDLVGATDDAGARCIGAIVGISGVPDNAWIVGDTLMKQTYRVFDEANAHVGFATPQ
ncbi:hypothetical protein FS749_015766 [Ceratobasidium sp. UAMH 11750]|nr:hypothetical protein FS749_015766 [Ceratobasidium sp. UAMH 11750]